MTQYLSFAADVLMIAASLGAAAYCFVLSRRLSRLTSFDKGIGGAIAVLSQQVDEMKSALTEAKAGTDGAGHHLQDLVRQAREISSELELMIAACHDFAEEAMAVQDPGPATPEHAVAADHAPVAMEPEPAAADPAPPEPLPAADEVAPPAPEDAPVPEDRPGGGETVAPVFGSRRAPPAAPVFRRHAQG